MFKLHISPQTPLLRKSGKLSTKNFGCDVSVRLSVQTLGEGMGVPRQTDGAWKMPYFLGRKSHGAFRQPAFFLAGNHMTTVISKKRFFEILACLAK